MLEENRRNWWGEATRYLQLGSLWRLLTLFFLKFSSFVAKYLFTYNGIMSFSPVLLSFMRERTMFSTLYSWCLALWDHSRCTFMKVCWMSECHGKLWFLLNSLILRSRLCLSFCIRGVTLNTFLIKEFQFHELLFFLFTTLAQDLLLSSTDRVLLYFRKCA